MADERLPAARAQSGMILTAVAPGTGAAVPTPREPGPLVAGTTPALVPGGTSAADRSSWSGGGEQGSLAADGLDPAPAAVTG